MKVENITNYGKGFIEQIPEINKLTKQMTIPMIKVLYREIGITGILKFIWKTGLETKKMVRHDWSAFEAEHGFSEENIKMLLESFATMKVMIAIFIFNINVIR